MDSLDDYDRVILHQLDKNARQTYLQIGDEVDLTKNVVAYRIKRMIKKGIIRKYSILINPFKLGFESYRIYLSYQYTTPLIEQRIINHFSDDPLNWWTISSEGRYDLAVITWVNNINRFYTSWKKTLSLFRDYFRKQNFSLYIQSISFLHDYLITERKIDKRTSFKFDENQLVTLNDLEKKILYLLSRNSRISVKQMSTKLHCSNLTIEKSMNRLQKKGIILGFHVDINLDMIGYKLYKADINLRNYKKIVNILNYIIKDPHLIRVDYSIGESDLELEFHVSNLNHFERIMQDLSETFSDSIRNYKYLSASKIHNKNYMPRV